MNRQVEYPRALGEIQAEIADLRQVKEAYERIPSRDFAVETSLVSLDLRESDLLAEESTALLLQEGGDVQVVLDGASVEANAIEASVLGVILSRMQGLFNAVAEGRAGSARSRGAVRLDIREAVQLRVTGFAAGSFAIRFSAPPEPEPLFGPGPLETTLSLFSPNPEEGEVLPLLRLSRVRSNYQSIMETLVTNRTSIAVAAREPASSRGFTSRMARQRLDWMELIDVGEQPLTLDGVLIGGNVEKHTYVLGVEGEHYGGKVLDRAINDLRRVPLGAEVTARLMVVTSEHADRLLEPKTKYFLEAIRLRGEEAQISLA